MAWTQDHVDALTKAIALGVKRVKYTSGETEYQSLGDMRDLLAEMKREVAGTPEPVTRRVARFSRGF